MTGKTYITLRKRLFKWWGHLFTAAWFDLIFTLHKSEAPRRKWCLFTALLGEWPTGQRLRHILCPGSPCPPCRFCGLATDSVKHWFGPNYCRALFDQLGRSIPLPNFPDGGWFCIEPNHAAWPSVFTAVYSVHCQLRWSGFDTLAPDCAILREGVWLARSQEIDAESYNKSSDKCRKLAARRQCKKRAFDRKREQREALLHCVACGLVVTSGQHCN